MKGSSFDDFLRAENLLEKVEAAAKKRLLEEKNNMKDSTQNKEIETGVKDSSGKVRVDLLPVEGLYAVAKVREYGNKKYGDPWKWLDYPDKHYAFIDAAIRHLLRYQSARARNDPADFFDEESGLHHVHHAATSLLMAITLNELHDVENNILRENILSDILKGEVDY